MMMNFSKHSQMRIWIDCSALIDWPLNHLTGIQRTVLGIYKGMKACGVEPHLFRYDSDSATFRELKLDELPALIRINIEANEWMSVDDELNTQTIAQEARTKNHENDDITPGRVSASTRILRKIIGEDLLGHELRYAISATNLALWQLREKGRAWVRARLGISSPVEKPMKNPQKTQEECLPSSKDMERTGLEMMIDGSDYVFSLGSECYQMPECMTAGTKLKERGAKLIRMVYDIIPVSQPQWVSDEAADVFRGALSDLLNQSDCLLTISAYSKSEILDFAKQAEIEAPPIEVVRLGEAIGGSKDRPQHVPKSDQIPAKPFFLCVGTIEPRKNHRLLYEVWRCMLADHLEDCPDLVCIGSHHEMCRQLIREMEKDPLVKGRILLLRGVSDQELEWYYNNCTATVFPSMYEGWGLPVAESLARGRMCLASNATSIPEISDLPVFFNPDNPLQLRDLIVRSIRDAGWREEVEAEIQKRFIPTDWKKTALQVLAAAETLKQI